MHAIRNRLRTLAIALVALMAVLGLTAQAKSDVTIAFTHDAISLNPLFITSLNERTLTYYLFDYLVFRVADGTVKPWLAESWELIDDVTWEFRLRDGVTFHNGERLDAEAVRFTYMTAKEIAPGRGQISTIRDVEVVDDLTVRFIMHDPDPAIMYRVVRYPIIPPAYWTEVGPEEFGLRPIGSGPYRLDEWARDERISMVAFEDYWAGPPPVIERVTFRPIPEYASRIAQLRTGEVDLVTHVVPDQAASVGAIPGIEIFSTPTYRTMLLHLRLDQEPLTDVRVRQAINYAIDREAIVNFMFDGYGVVARSQAMSENHEGFHPGLDPWPYDPERARQLLAEAGYPDGFGIEMQVPAGRYTLDRETGEVIAAQLGAVGIRVDLNPMEWGVFETRRREGRTMGLAYVGHGATADGIGNYHSMFTTGEPLGAGLYYSDPEIDRLNRIALSTLDTQEQLGAIHQVAEKVAEDALAVFLFYPVEIYAVREGIDFNPMPSEHLDLISGWVFERTLNGSD